MKIQQLCGLMLLVSFTAIAQQKDRIIINTYNTPEIAREKIYNTSNKLVNNYKTTLTNAVNCKRAYDPLSYLADNMTPDAKIEVSNTRNHRKKSYPAIKYLDMLRSMVCSDNPIYESIKFSFTNFPLADSCIHQDDFNHYIVRVKLGQTFSAYNKESMVYSDYTIKVIVIDFGPGRQGTYDAKITQILIDSTNSSKE